MKTNTVSGQFVDLNSREIYPAEVHIAEGKIKSVTKVESAAEQFIIPGFVDAHVHIESSMLTPSEFARLAVVHGTVATVSDPHEIANVLGLKGVEFMIENGSKVPLKFNFGAPSCVPATIFETAGAEIDAEGVRELLEKDEVKYLAEMMNWPGVLHQDPMVMEKIKIAHDLGKPVDGHAPGLKGEQAKQYASVGISTDHECFTKEEALDKLAAGMKILIREGSAAKNFEALIDLMGEHADKLMFCSDDKHPDELAEGHINQLCARAVAKGFDVFDVLIAACENPVKHYKLDVGLLKEGDAADFVLVEDLKNFHVINTYINGELVAENGYANFGSVEAKEINQFDAVPTEPADFVINKTSEELRVIEVLDGELITKKIIAEGKEVEGKLVADTESDLLKIAVLNRYSPSKPAVAFIKNFGLKTGAIASSVAHDSHNIIAVGTSDEALSEVINLLIEQKGGVAAWTDTVYKLLPLPIAGLLTNADGLEVAEAYASIDLMAKEMGSKLRAPFMSLSFMALLVIPAIKLSDKGLFDAEKFEFIDVNV
ncbi:adenine deaminase [Flammeovirgaceae bacterium SG7u.111]|nr:adenine deaminase [Flammeovirgaceae bacterium SG7u.132]WPO38148.1 adenine deaminase [Flammeovirgaceae bacterium SG7u.111]